MEDLGLPHILIFDLKYCIHINLKTTFLFIVYLMMFIINKIKWQTMIFDVDVHVIASV